ncbi:MAG: hypothetical protein AB1894_27030 [Chloroflexota bacterium]
MVAPTPATFQKRRELSTFIERQLAHEPAVQAVIGIGSLASGLARPDSDIDAILFLEPFDAYIVPAEFKWRSADGSFHSIFAGDIPPGDCLNFDFVRLDLAQWADLAYEWPEARRAELSQGWMAFDRTGRVAELIAARTTYSDEVRIAKLDDAITWLDQHLSEDGPQVRWESLGPAIAHDRLQAAYEYLAQALFAYNRTWRPWRNREMSVLLTLPWLPQGFPERVLGALCAPSPGYRGYMARAQALLGLFHDLLARLSADGVYGEDCIGEAFIRSHEEPGRAWNMAEWNLKHKERTVK